MSLQEDLLKSVERETGGQLATERLDYQLAWGISHLIETHLSGQSYAIGFEYHDDIIMIDNITSPTKVRFYQVKSSKASTLWSVGELSKKKSDESASICGKLVANREKFIEHTDHLALVSNRRVKFLKGDNPITCFAEAEIKDWNKFVENLQIEYPHLGDDEFKLLHFHETDIPIERSSTLIRGMIAELVSKELGQGDYDLNTFYLMIADECRHKSKKLADIGSFEALIGSKFVTRENVYEWLETLRRRALAKADWSNVLPNLSDIPLKKQRDLRMGWFQYEARRFSQTERRLGKVKEIIRANIDSVDFDTLWDMTSLMLDLVRAEMPDSLAGISDDYIRAIALYEWESHD